MKNVETMFEHKPFYLSRIPWFRKYCLNKPLELYLFPIADLRCLFSFSFVVTVVISFHFPKL